MSSYSYAKMMPATARLLEMADEGQVTWEALARDLLAWLGESSAREFADCNYSIDLEGDD